MGTISDVYSTVNAAWSEGRLENILQRQKELAALHSNIKKSSVSLINAISHDLQATHESATEELQLVLNVVNHLYESLDFPASIAKERSIQRGSSAPDNLVPLGPCLIDPAIYAPVSSTLVPLAAAVAAGSAAIVLAMSAYPTIDAELRKVVKESMDVEAIAITENDSADTRQQLGVKFFGVAVLQNLAERDNLLKLLHQKNPWVRVLTPSAGVPTIFVDRSARDLEAVSTHLCRAVLSAPRHNPLRVARLCFVDESLVDQLTALLRQGGTGTVGVQGSDQRKAETADKLLRSKFLSLSQKPREQSPRSLPAITALSKHDQITAENIRAVAHIVTESHDGVLLIPIRSLDHGIDLQNKLNEEAPSQTTYVFGESRAAFYVGTFSKTLQVFINQIPVWSSAAIIPSSPSVRDQILYSREDFSVNKSIIQTPLKPAYKSFWPITSQKLRLDRIKQPKGGRLSYFERGLIVGLLVTVLTISGVSVTASRAYSYFLRRM